MMHVPDDESTVDWYKEIGFTLTDSFDDDGEMNWHCCRVVKAK